ncbi:hypothetical protein [Serratia proteamaculans]|uniref:hypothetical protein n=1 Tax=Serratia proteamaculans TaxID=28151 RepID=UPI0021BDB2DF|nr:hypothetical protein [Serratia proteamaculans]
MTILTKRLKEIAEDGFLAHGEAKAMAALLLKFIEAQPVAHVATQPRKDMTADCVGYEWEGVSREALPHGTSLYVQPRVNPCSPCNERYCGNCIHANGAIVQ